MKKIIPSLAVAAAILAATSMSAFAHGHGRCVNTAGTGYALCTVEDCNITGAHKHGDTTYAGHWLGDGHDYHQLCSVEGCVRTGVHEHDGVTCFPHTSGDGHGYHRAGYGRHHR